MKITECMAQGEMKVVGTGEVSNVRILGRVSHNKRVYTKEALQKAIPLYEGKLVNVDHPTSESASVSATSRFGWISGIEMKEDGLYAKSFKYNPAHPFAETFSWWAGHNPSAIGFSHNAYGEGETRDGVFVINEIKAVESVDVVANPATTNGLFEEMQMENPGSNAPPSPTDADMVGSPSWKTSIGDACAMIVSDSKLTTAEKLAKIKTLLKLQDDAPKEEPKEAPKPDAKADEAKAIGVAGALKLFQEANFPAPLVSYPLLNAVSLLPTTEAKALIEAQKQFTTSVPPQSFAPSNPQNPNPAAGKEVKRTAEEIAAALRN